MSNRLSAALLSVLACTALPRTATADALGPSRPSDLVSRVVFYSPTAACAGMTNAVELSGTPIPPIGRVFILTSYQWNVAVSNYPAMFPISVGLASVDDSSGINTSNIIAYSTAPNTATGAVTQNASIPNGVVAIRPSVGKTHLCIFPGTAGVTLSGLGWVQGYFATDR